MDAPAIDPAWTVNELLASHPEVIGVLNDFGVDTCCGGQLTLREASDADGIDEDDLLAAIARAIRPAAARVGE